MAETRLQQAVNIIESEELAQYIHPSLLLLDYHDLLIRLVLVTGSFFLFALIFIVTLFLSNCVSAFERLGLKFRVFMSLSIVRAVYGVFGILFGSYVIFANTNLDRDVVYGTNATSYLAMLISLGFFIFELLAVVVSDIVFQSFSRMLLTHHGLALMGYLTSVCLNANFCFACKGMILEMSTPFSCLCYVLLKAGMESSRWWKINQMILIHTFHLRSMVECHLWYIMYTNWSHISQSMPPLLLAVTLANLMLITFVMTPYWGYKKTHQLFHPVDWNFHESRSTNHISHEQSNIVNQNMSKED